MNEKRSCITCQEVGKTEAILALICIIFNTAVIGVVTFLCINSIVKSPDNGLRIFINVFILVIIYIILGWIIKKEVTKLYLRKVTSLKIIQPNKL